MTSNTSASLRETTDERLHTLSEIAHDCFGIETFSTTDQTQARYVVCAASIARALESAYDIGLITGYRLNRATRAR
jgi:hypothetical protein